MRLHDEDDMCVDEGYDGLVSAIARAAEPMPAGAREAVRARLMASVKPHAVSLRMRLFRPAVALATTGALLGGVSYAAAESRPGQALFGLKQSIVSTVSSAQRVLSERTAPTRVPAVLKPLEAPAPVHVDPTRIPEIKQAIPKSAAPTQSPQAGSGKSKGQGKAKTVVPKSRGNGNGNGNGNGSQPKQQTHKRTTRR